jgi:hypothetical protein
MSDVGGDAEGADTPQPTLLKTITLDNGVGISVDVPFYRVDGLDGGAVAPASAVLKACGLGVDANQRADPTFLARPGETGALEKRGVGVRTALIEWPSGSALFDQHVLYMHEVHLFIGSSSASEKKRMALLKCLSEHVSLRDDEPPRSRMPLSDWIDAFDSQRNKLQYVNAFVDKLHEYVQALQDKRARGGANISGPLRERGGLRNKALARCLLGSAAPSNRRFGELLEAATTGQGDAKAAANRERHARIEAIWAALCEMAKPGVDFDPGDVFAADDDLLALPKFDPDLLATLDDLVGPLESPEALSKEDRTKRLRECMPHHRKPVGASAKEREWIGPKVILKFHNPSTAHAHGTRAAAQAQAAVAAMETD